MDWQNAIRASKLREGKSKMVTVGSKILMIVNLEGVFHATEGLCKHMKWPLSWGGKIENGCIRCPLHQTTHCISDGSLVEWAPFPLFPPYGRLVGSMVSEKDLGIFETRVESGFVQVLI
ncbi:MAG TPA: Rieske 2Fe-2S domain-containing protein [Candidatus Thalassarchaeaceae archaeon]|mgnify:FL=1|jgi:nitrite reductase/ring-hydroxylating ferredoxin subunit|nr:Rieske 2Fe-2S domain-containing protein [Candidatus Thalassarchaeaceae archaeon]|tara:strand:+ start:200 stop:556 length:357 start_codon:yes stop_codon:yes gene_type:complete